MHHPLIKRTKLNVKNRLMWFLKSYFVFFNFPWNSKNELKVDLCVMYFYYNKFNQSILVFQNFSFILKHFLSPFCVPIIISSVHLPQQLNYSYFFLWAYETVYLAQAGNRTEDRLTLQNNMKVLIVLYFVVFSLGSLEATHS